MVMTLMGPDRPGLVEKVAATVAEHGGSWIESRMSHLAGQFAGICRATVPEDKAPALRAALEQLAGQDLRLLLATDPQVEPKSEGRLAQLELIGHDRVGIVQQICGVLASHGVNVEELNTGCESAPMTGERLFRATATLRFGPAVSMDAVRDELETLGEEWMVELSMQEA
ncbi:MAG: ACT domain-containing protein [Phycisphaeraceae bacterium]|nr:ACT domain-containing protein [Phycisphaeraceae bacterium]